MATRNRQPTIPITEIEHAAFCKPEDELPAKSLAEEMAVNIRWQKISNEYLHLSAEELDQRIHEAKQKLGKSVTILKTKKEKEKKGRGRKKERKSEKEGEKIVYIVDIRRMILR